MGNVKEKSAAAATTDVTDVTAATAATAAIFPVSAWGTRRNWFHKPKTNPIDCFMAFVLLLRLID